MKKLIEKRDNEKAHGVADKLLCEALKIFGMNELVDDFDKINKWYS